MAKIVMCATDGGRMLGNTEIVRNFLILNMREEQLQPASYDLTLDYMEDIKTHERVISIPPGESVLATTVERVMLPNDIAGFIKDKSSYLRLGLGVGQGFIDPGFEGNLTVKITNNTKYTQFLTSGKPFCQIVFDYVVGSDFAYDGHYQNQQGIGVSILND